MSNEIVTSAGSVGVESRSFDRTYMTLAEPCTDAHRIQRLTSFLAARTAHGRSRSVLRLITDSTTLYALAEQGLRPEVAVNLEHYDTADSFLVMFGHNAPDRAIPLTPADHMLEITEPKLEPATDLLADNDRFSFLRNPNDAHAESLFALWGNTFDWERTQVDAFIRSLDRESEEGEDRATWFSSIVTVNTIDGTEQIASAAMAERIDLQGFEQTVHLVESTEWRTDPDKRGLASFVLRNLNVQILRDLSSALIVAECNFLSRAYRAGHRAGFIVPERTFADQLLIQNVGVDDGRSKELYRDFVFMVLSEVERQRLLAEQQEALICL